MRQEGYLLVDNRGAGLGMAEYQTLTCSHCTSIVVVNPARQRERYKCKKCSSYICDNCAAEAFATGTCVTMAQKIDEVLEAAEAGLEPSKIWLP